MVKSIIDMGVQIQVYKKYKSELFQTNGKAKACSDKIYQTLISELTGMNKKSIQTSINRYVNEILAEQHGDQDQEPHKNENYDNNVPFEFVDVKDKFKADDTRSEQSQQADDTLILSSTLSVGSIDGKVTLSSEQTSETSLNEALYSLYHKKTLQDQAQQLNPVLENTNLQLSVCQQARSEEEEALKEENKQLRQQIQAFEQSRSEQDAVAAALLGQKNELMDRMKTADDEIMKLNAKAETLQLEIITLNDSKQQFSHDYQEMQNELEASERNHSESLAREKLAEDEIMKLNAKAETLQLEIITLTDSKQQMSRDYQAMKNELEASKRNHSESLARKKLAEDEPPLKVQKSASQSRTNTILSNRLRHRI